MDQVFKMFKEPAAKKSKKMAKLCKMEDNFPVDANNPSLETHKNDKLFIERFSSLFNAEKLSDIVLAVGDQRFYAHKFMLIVSSDVFEVMFNEIRWKESSQVEVSLTEELECVAVFPHFLRYIYTGGVSLTTDNVLPILLLADKYNIPALGQTCVEYMLHHVVENPDTNRTLSWYQYAKITANTLLVDKCRKFILSNFDIILQTSDWMTLTKAEVCEFLSSNDLVVSDEYYLWMMVDKWFSCDCHQPSSKDVEDIISLIHFTMIPPKQLLEIEKSCLYLNHKEFFREKLNLAYRHHSLLLDSVDLKGTEERFRNYTSECYRICCDLNMSHYLSTEKCQSKINQRIISSYDFFSAPSGLSKNNQAEFDITLWPKGPFKTFQWYGKLSDNASLSIRMIPKKQEHLLIGITFIVYGIKNGVRYVAYSYANKNTFSNTNTLFVEDNLMSLKRFNEENSPFLISGNLEAKLFLKVEEVIMPEQKTP
ncbi:BTB/POZ domain-containing protein 17-like [Dreissena polymorpha]|uniref:BTB domain-containing protein n=1 Tax=Dreissena polymorpha TaxID=45954 RepID=A0A9D4CHY4_DREPO|nr:BTB/POZ domain-containing protein 17-like [Dreissena polymorpha]KAH3725252.1 hypothetical protein DPMN_051087 [Dreissena polymorpha]